MYKASMGSKNQLGVPHETLDVSRARYYLTRLLHRLRAQPRIYVITQSGKPAGALVSLDWLRALLDQGRSTRRFSLFGQARAAKDWEQTLAQLRKSLEARAVGRYPSADR